MNDEVTYEQGEYGRRAVLHSGWSRSMLVSLARGSPSELELNMAKGWRGNDLSFLVELPALKACDILDLTIRNIEPIHHLHQLKRLGVTTYCTTEIDFSAFPELESCSLEWRPKAKSLFECVTLKKLFVNRYRGKDTGPFAKLVNLRSLAILNAPVRDLHGLSNLSRLRSLRLTRLRQLASLSGIEPLRQLEELMIQSCKAIRSINEVSALPNVRQLFLNNGGNIDSLKPLENVKCLECLLFYESTNIVDGDLSPLLRLPKLADLSFMNRKHYSHRREEFAAYWGKEGQSRTP